MPTGTQHGTSDLPQCTGASRQSRPPPPGDEQGVAGRIAAGSAGIDATGWVLVRCGPKRGARVQRLRLAHCACRPIARRRYAVPWHRSSHFTRLPSALARAMPPRMHRGLRRGNRQHVHCHPCADSGGGSGESFSAPCAAAAAVAVHPQRQCCSPPHAGRCTRSAAVRRGSDRSAWRCSRAVRSWT